MQYRTLIVDDSRLARMAITSAIRRLHPEWELLEAGNVLDALDVLSANSIDIALVDFNMPEIDGLEFVSRLRQNHPTMPIAAVTANIQDEIVARARELNALCH